VTDLNDAGRDVYIQMLLGSRDIYEKIPSQVRDRIHNEWRDSVGDGAHQIFGLGRDLQGYLEEMDDHLMLLELNHDDMMHWEWGDLGVIQFFITPEAVSYTHLTLPTILRVLTSWLHVPSKQQKRKISTTQTTYRSKRT